MRKIFTIGFTRKTAEEFFKTLKKEGVKKVIDVRFNNTSQLLGFSKYPDIEYLLSLHCIDYVHDKKFAPSEKILKRYKKNVIGWDDYEKEFADLMAYRDIDVYIADKYSDADNICLLCTEVSSENCHRRLVAEKIAEVLGDVEIIHLGED